MTCSFSEMLTSLPLKAAHGSIWEQLWETPLPILHRLLNESEPLLWLYPSQKKDNSSSTLPRRRAVRRRHSQGPGHRAQSWSGASAPQHMPPVPPDTPSPGTLHSLHGRGFAGGTGGSQQPWERHLANSKLSDLERVKVLPWQKKLPRNPENIGRDVGYKLLA